MIELGNKDKIFGAHLLKALTIRGRPSQFPLLPKNHAVICGYDQGLGERMIVCENLEDMQALYDAHSHGGALRISWYLGEDPGFVTPLPGQPPA